jgi:D-alanyl-D-alanine carboxypeptidase
MAKVERARIENSNPMRAAQARRRYTLLAVAMVLALAAPARADQIDDYVRAEMAKQHIPGLALAVVKDGSVVRTKGYGLANIELNVAAQPDTVFKIGSISKQFIAAGIMLLVQDGKLNVDDKISRYLEGTLDAWKDITIRHLLTHTSGIVREAPGFDPLKVQSDADVIKTAYSLPLRFKPGEKWEYCNVGYFALAEIIHKVAGLPWPEFLSERVFKPLGMNSTRTTTVSDVVPNRASGYVWNDGKFKNAGEWSALRPSGAFLSTTLDLAKWDAALYTNRILAQASRDQMWTPLANTSAKPGDDSAPHYGFGWFVARVQGHRDIYHGGSLPGFRAEIDRFLDDRLTIIVLTNGDNAKPESVARGISGFYIAGLASTAAN